MLVRTLVTFAKAAGDCRTTKGATVLVGGIVMMLPETAEAPARPFAPNATACSELLPNGAFVDSPSSTLSTKNSAFLTVPSRSEAVAWMVKRSGAVKTARFVGFVRATFGGKLKMILGRPAKSISKLISELVGLL